MKLELKFIEKTLGKVKSLFSSILSIAFRFIRNIWIFHKIMHTNYMFSTRAIIFDQNLWEFLPHEVKTIIWEAYILPT